MRPRVTGGPTGDGRAAAHAAAAPLPGPRAAAALLAGALGGVLAGACAPDRAAAPPEVDVPPLERPALELDVVALVAGARLPAGVGSLPVTSVMPVRTPAISGVPPQELLPGLEQCAWADDAQAFVCPRVARLRTAIAYQYTPFDSAGRAQRRPSPGATAAVRVRVARADTTLIPGGPSTPFGTFAAANEQTLTLSGLRGGALTLDGTMTAAVEGAVTNVQGPGGPGSGPPGAVAVRLRITQVVAGLVLPAGDARWPAAGTLTTELRDAATGATALRQVVTFDGTRTAAVEEVADGAVRRCTFDLDAPSLPTTCAG